MIEDVLEHGNLLWVILVSGRSPANMTFEVLFPENRKTEDMLLDVCHEALVRVVTAHLQLPPDVLEEVHMAELWQDIGKDVLCGHSDGLTVITGHGDEWVVHILQLREELYPPLEALARCQETHGNVMRPVVDAVEQWNLPLVSLHLHVLPIHDEFSPESLPVAEIVCHIVVVGQGCQLPCDAPVGRPYAYGIVIGQRPDAGSLEVEIEERFLPFPAMINAEPASTILALVSSKAISGTTLLRVHAPAELTGDMASTSGFLRMDMFNSGNTAILCYEAGFLRARNETLSKEALSTGHYAPFFAVNTQLKPLPSSVPELKLPP